MRFLEYAWKTISKAKMPAKLILFALAYIDRADLGKVRKIREGALYMLFDGALMFAGEVH